MLSPRDLGQRLAGPGICVRTGPFVSRLHSPIRHLARALHYAYADFPTDDGDGFVDFHIRIGTPRGARRWIRPQALFQFDDQCPFKPFPRRLAAPLLEWGWNWCVVTQAHQYLMLHAAVLARDDRAVLLPGRPGAGKSTLCAALALTGWRLLSDEIAIIRPEDGRIVPLPRPVSLKNESIDVIRRFSPDARIGFSWDDTVKGTVAHMRPPGECIAEAGQPAVPAWIVFPQYVPEVTARSRPLAKGTAFMQLAGNAFNYSTLGTVGFDTMTRLIERCDCYEFVYGDLETALQRFEKLSVPNGPVPDGNV